jgi:O-acetyl-ADP-ribose deacetylase
MNEVVKEYTSKSGIVVKLVQGDITLERVDVLVNAANSQLIHGGGVAGTIVRRGGLKIQQESYELAPVDVGKAVITTGGMLEAEFVIHTVGPRWGEGDEENKLHSAISSALNLANEKRLKLISLPAVSTGIFGFPLESAVNIILGAIKEFVNSKNSKSLKEIRICIIDNPTLSGFEIKWNILQ